VKQKILIADNSSFYRKVTIRMLTKIGFEVFYANSIADSLLAIEAHNFTAYLVDIQLEDGSGFDLYNKILSINKLSKVIMTTEEDIDQYFDDIVRNKVSILLVKPIKTEELKSLISKFVYEKDIFGLDNYLYPLKELKRIRIISSQQIKPAVEGLMDTAKNWEFKFFNYDDIGLIIREMCINALYHSYGKTLEKENRTMITLDEGKYVDLRFGKDEFKFGVSITDYMGKLTRDKIFETILSNVAQQKFMQEGNIDSIDNLDEFILPKGRGLDMARKLSGEYYFNIKRNIKTEIIFIFDSRFDKDDFYSSIKIFEQD